MHIVNQGSYVGAFGVPLGAYPVIMIRLRIVALSGSRDLGRYK